MKKPVSPYPTSRITPRRGARHVRTFLAALMVTGVLQAVLVVAPGSSPLVSRADAVVTGNGGMFVPAVGRLVDSTNGVGGYTGPTTPYGWRTYYPMAMGKFGIPSSGVDAVQVTLIAVTPAAAGSVHVRPTGGANSWGALTYHTGVTGSVSNTAIVALGTNGGFDVETDTSINMIIDVQGYFTSGTTAAGGYVPSLAPARIMNTVTGVGSPKAVLTSTSVLTVNVGGYGGVPTNASAVVLNFEILNHAAGSGYINPYPADATAPTVSLNFAAGDGVNTSVSSTVDLSPSGQIKVATGLAAGSTIDLMVNVVGYYTALDPNSSSQGIAAFTPASARVLTNFTVNANSTSTVPIAGVQGVPTIGSGINAAVVNIQVRQTTSTGGGSLGVWGDDQTNPGTAVLNYQPGATRSNFATIPLGTGGGVVLYNYGPNPISVYIDIQGWYITTDAVVAGGQTATQKSVVLDASPVGIAAGRPWVTYRYRTQTSGPFIQVPPAHVVNSSGVHPSTWPVSATGTGTSATFTPYTWNLKATLGDLRAAPTSGQMVQVQACYGATATDTALRCGVLWAFTYAPAAFGYASATTTVGPGELSLLTGDYQISAVDAAAASSLGGLEVGRTLTTYKAPNSTMASTAGSGASPAAGIFGPGWSADLTGPSTGAATMTVTDNHAKGYFTFTDTDGASYVYQAGLATETVTPYTGVGDAAGDGVVVTWDSTQPKLVTMSEDDGTQTIFTLADSVSGQPARGTVSKVVEPGNNTTTSYSYNGAGQVKRILAPGPANVTCTDANADTTPGCRSLLFNYTSAGDRLDGIELSIPQSPTATNLITVAKYAYDSAGRLSQAWDPRDQSVSGEALKTTYSYLASGVNAGRLASIAPPGEEAWSLVYDSDGRLSKIQRNMPVGNPVSGVVSKTATTSIVYDLPLTGSGLPPMTMTNTKTWGQTRSVPAEGNGTAVFGADHVPSGDPATPVTIDAGGGEDWKYATLHYLDVNGRETNTSNWGQRSVTDGTGAWLIDTTQYDAVGNAVWRLSADNRAQAITTTPDTDAFAAAGATAAQRADMLADTALYDALDPGKVTDTYGPTHPIQLANGTAVHGRVHVHTEYDQGAPNNGLDPNGNAFRLPTTVTTTVYDTATEADIANTTSDNTDVSIQRYGYDPVGSMNGTISVGGAGGKTVDFTGWNLRRATSSTLQMGASPSSEDLVTTTVYDPDGRVTEARLPGNATGDAAGTSPRTTTTIYYTAPASGSSGECVSAVWAGLVCKTSPGGQPTGDFADAPLPTVLTVYDSYGNPTKTTETYASAGSTGAGGSGAPTRTTTTIYDDAGRIVKTAIATTNTPGSKPVPDVTFGYSSTTGRPITQTTGTGSSAKTITTSYNGVGQVSSYTDASPGTTSERTTYTGYDIVGRAVSIVDAKGATTWDFDSSAEHRGMVSVERHASTPTSASILGSSGSTDSDGNLDLSGTTATFGFTAAYNAAGAQVTQGYPNGLTATTTYDNTGNATTLKYTKSSDGASATWMAFSHTAGTGGRIVAESATLSASAASNQTYAYDPAGRLTKVQDTVNPPISGTGSTTCTTRIYGYDQHSNRTSLKTYPAATGGACSTSTSASAVTSTYDSADRIVASSNGSDGAYSYDPMGRTLTLPGSDATASGSSATATGQATFEYFDNDLAATQNQGSGTNALQVDFTLDVQQNRFAEQTTVVGASGSAVATTVTNHFDGDSDAPSWTSTTPSSAGASVWEAYILAPRGGLGAVVSSLGQVTLQLTNLDGDVVAAVPFDGTVDDLLGSYAESTEFGAPRDLAKEMQPYGWLGASQRSNNSVAGLALMGVRLYSPATGRFLSTDPVVGANANAYTYPLDPISTSDESGEGPTRSGDDDVYFSRWEFVDDFITVGEWRGHIEKYGPIKRGSMHRYIMHEYLHARTIYRVRDHKKVGYEYKQVVKYFDQTYSCPGYWRCRTYKPIHQFTGKPLYWTVWL
ncbi:RHS repeat-associated core domain-containing protein [Nocardioides sp. CER19]|uniref:RHS repeat-associated core domain-containing protein n=1 Tax=Nocardioides sp. CER19 TaxID=3038538 RepID=UPI0024480D00|nr:RHS repeat-associated core domain-containing protein [Nocardioides sp. CER19]MDH2415265.1 RHS repeat-associated core domain-containing protein [Nocardioides sp. CER19]